MGTGSEYSEEDDQDEERLNEKIFELGVDGAIYHELE
jgi:hypothetical protein